MRYSICVTTPEVTSSIPVALLEGEFPDRCKKAAQLGYEGLELMVIDPKQLDVQRVQDHILSNGLSVSAISSGAVAKTRRLTLLAEDVTTRNESRTLLLELVDTAAALKASVVTIGSFKGKAEAVGGKQNARKVLGSVFCEALSKAESFGISIALEPLNRYESDFLNTAEEVLQFVELFKTNNLGLLLDTYHMNIEESSFSKCFELVLKHGRLFHVHIADNNRYAPGRGHIDFISIIQVLLRNQYRGFLSAELLPLQSSNTTAEEVLKAMKDFEKMATQ
jgi:sugar phosphate isomerase/epimerase